CCRAWSAFFFRLAREKADPGAKKADQARQHSEASAEKMKEAAGGQRQDQQNSPAQPGAQGQRGERNGSERNARATPNQNGASVASDKARDAASQMEQAAQA